MPYFLNRDFFDRYLLWPLLLTGHLLAVSLLAWHLLAQVNFVYPLGYQWLDIHTHIQTFGPENRYKDHFERTSKEERYRLFDEIARAIQNGGQGLENIHYTLPDGQREPLLRPPEIVHLQDVANLVRDVYWLGLSGAVVFILTLSYAWYRRRKLPSARKLLVGFTIVIAVSATFILLIGPVRVFYTLHDYIFPDDNPWFFYYQDSLMTTLMKAPDLFGLIAVFLVTLIAVLWGLSVWAMAVLLRRRAH